MELIARYLLDTNAIIYLVNGRLASPLPEGKYSISIITEIELLSFSGLSDEEEQRIRDFLHLLDRVPLSDTVRDQAIRLRRRNRMKLPDAIIAASALTQQAILLTNDQSFASIDGLDRKALQLK
jgi:predicted nucleic acid-binding protein